MYLLYQELKPVLEVGLKRMKDTPPLKSISAALGREVTLEEVQLGLGLGLGLEVTLEEIQHLKTAEMKP